MEIAVAKEAVLEDQIAEAPSVRQFLRPIRHSTEISLVAEVKKSSPSKGIIRADFEPVKIAQSYEAAGATYISVLTELQMDFGFATNNAECESSEWYQ